MANIRHVYVLLLILLALISAYLSSGIFVVAADQQAVVRRFGAIAARVGPGIHYRLPWPVDQVDILQTTSVLKTGVGFELPANDADSVTGVQLLTGDTNILSVALAFQYIISQPADYLFQTESPDLLIGSLAEAVLTEAMIGMPVDEVLTTGRLALQEQVKTRAQALLDRYRSGIQITSANIMTITLDKAVAEAFQQVADASAEREKKINEARAYANNLLPKARGEAHSQVLAAESYKEQRIAEAIGNSDRFLALLAEYKKAPDITRLRLYFEAMEKILPDVKKYLIDSEQGKVPFNLRITDP
jgi:membrane protease subunit HflK